MPRKFVIESILAAFTENKMQIAFGSFSKKRTRMGQKNSEINILMSPMWLAFNANDVGAFEMR